MRLIPKYQWSGQFLSLNGSVVATNLSPYIMNPNGTTSAVTEFSNWNDIRPLLRINLKIPLNPDVLPPLAPPDDELPFEYHYFNLAQPKKLDIPGGMMEGVGILHVDPLSNTDIAKQTNAISSALDPSKMKSIIKPGGGDLAGGQWGGWGYVSAASDLIGGLMPLKTEYSGTYGNLAQSLDKGYDAIANGVAAIPGFGTAASAIMKAGAALGKGVNALGGGTDGMTRADAILGSSFLNLTPLGLINGFGGKKALTITADTETLENVGASYGGSVDKIEDALTKSGKKYGLFSSKARTEANLEIAEAKRLQGIMRDISEEASDRFDLSLSMAAINGNAYMFGLQGGYDQRATRVGKHGLKFDLNQAIRNYYSSIITPITEDVLQSYQKGGVITPMSDDELRKYLKGGRTLDLLVAYAKEKNPRFILRMSEPYKAILKDGKDATHLLSWMTETGDDGKDYAVVYPQVMEDENGNLKVYDNAYEEAKKRGDILIMTPDEAEFFTADNYKKGWPDFFKPRAYREGGAFNVIPDGALHARRHNMDVEGITKKGVPVVDNFNELLAEVESGEIILRLEVTKKLEDLRQQYETADSEEKKNELAHEAGKILIAEIMYNTRDNSGIMKKLEENG